MIVLVGGNEPKSILFCRENPEREVWGDGFRHGPEAACDRFGFDRAYPFSAFEQKLPELIANRSSLWHALGHDAAWDTKIVAALNTVRAQTRAGKRAPGEIHDLHAPLDRMRLRKDAHEMAIMRRAAAIASSAHARAMRALAVPAWPNTNSVAELGHEFRQRGATGHAYSPIVAGGSNALRSALDVENDKALAEMYWC